MTSDGAAEILLVRAVEEAGVETLPAEARLDAFEAAGDLDDARSWLERRAAYLLAGPFARYRPLLAIREALRPPAWLNLGVPFAVGLASNYLGPRDRIHVLYNPIFLLVVWNLAVYAVLAGRAALPVPARAQARPDRPKDAGQGADARPRLRSAPRGRSSPSLFLRLFRRAAADLWLRLHRSVASARRDAKALTRVGQDFLREWEVAARPLFALSARRALHRGAASLALGAVAGLFVRGLFFRYEMVWRSTFVNDPETVAVLLRVALGPAAWLLGRPLPGVQEARLLATPEGVGAAPWIELHALTAALLVVLPRMALGLWAGRRIRHRGAAIELPLHDRYTTALLGEARALRIDRLRDTIGTEVEVECGKFAEAVAVFVGEALYERRIVPRVRRFRREGGTLADLQADVRRESEAFEAELQAHLAEAQAEFEASLTRALVRKAGDQIPLPEAWAGRFEAAAGEIPGASIQDVPSALSSELVRPVAAAVAGSVAAIFGTLGGGFGHHVGVALLVGLLGTTGPVGFLIGALGGALGAGAALWLGRDHTRSRMEQLRLPGRVVRLALPAGRFERILAEGKDACRRSVRTFMTEQLAPTTDEIADQIWSRVKPLLVQAVGPGSS